MYKYETFNMDNFDEQGLGYPDLEQLENFINEKSKEGYEFVSMNDKVIVFRKENG